MKKVKDFFSKIKNDKKALIMFCCSALLMVLLVGFSFAYFSAVVTKKNETETKIKTNILGLTYFGDIEINCSNIIPGDICTKKFSVENTSNRAVSYNIYMEAILNEFDSDLVYTLVDDKGTVIVETPLPGTNPDKTYLKKDITIDALSTTNYTLKIEFKYFADKNQDINQGKEFKGTVGIDTNPETGNEIGSIDENEIGGKTFYYIKNTDVRILFDTEEEAINYLTKSYVNDYYGEEITKSDFTMNDTSNAGYYYASNGDEIYCDFDVDTVEECLVEYFSDKNMIIEAINVSINETIDTGVGESITGYRYWIDGDNYSYHSSYGSYLQAVYENDGPFIVFDYGNETYDIYFEKEGNVLGMYDYLDYSYAEISQLVDELNANFGDYVNAVYYEGLNADRSNIPHYEIYDKIFDAYSIDSQAEHYYARTSDSILYFYDISGDSISSGKFLYLDGEDFNDSPLAYLNPYDGFEFRIDYCLDMYSGLEDITGKINEYGFEYGYDDVYQYEYEITKLYSNNDSINVVSGLNGHVGLSEYMNNKAENKKDALLKYLILQNLIK